MARRIPLPRLTQRQRMARWQRERRQQSVVVVAFSSVLFFVLGLSAWAAADRYYSANLKPAATYASVVIPMREYQRELRYQLIQYFVEINIPKELENDPRLAQDKSSFEPSALDRVVEFAALETAAARDGVAVAEAEVDRRYSESYTQYRSRHVLVIPKADATDKDTADKEAQAKAKAAMERLRAAPNDQDLWNKVASETSEDPGSKDSGGELGFASKGQFVKEFEDAALKLAVGEISDPVKSQFGWHVLQVQERKAPEDGDLVKRYLSSGFALADVKAHVRYELLKEEFARRAEETAARSPTEQVKLAKILISTPAPSGADFSGFTEGLRKISEATAELEKGTDFAEVAKKYSGDASAPHGGLIGWFARGMLTDLRAEEELFSLEAGKVSKQYSTRTHTTIYKVVEKDLSRPLEEAQTKTLKDNAYTYWLEREKRANGAQKLVPGYQLD